MYFVRIIVRGISLSGDLVNEMARILKPGGLLFVTVPQLLGNEQVGSALFLVAVVTAFDLSWLGWLWWILVFDEILAHFIHTDLGHRRIVGLTIDVQHIFHAPDKVSIRLFREAPGFL